MSGDPDEGGDDPAEETDATDEDDPFEVIDEPETSDPFERIDVEDRDADPFDQIGSPDSSSAGDASDEPYATGEGGTAAEDSSATPPFDETMTAGQSGGDGAEDPFADFGRDERGGDPFEGLSERSFKGEESAQPDADLWEELSKRAVEPETEREGQRRFAEVSKHTYCERCEYFSKPPEISCSHEGTDIIEFTDFATVRVADCPIVAEREQLADIDRER